MTFLVGLLHLAHSIASSDYILVATLGGKVSAGTYLAWLAAAVAGNVVGGVIIVSLLNFGQVRVGRETTKRRERELAEEARVEQEREHRADRAQSLEDRPRTAAPAPPHAEDG